jgi:hypothetical protein
MRQLGHIDDVETADRAALRHHRTDVLRKLAAPHELDHARGRIRAVATHSAASHAVEPRARTHCANEQHLASMLGRERTSIEANHVHPRTLAWVRLGLMVTRRAQPGAAFGVGFRLA